MSKSPRHPDNIQRALEMTRRLHKNPGDKALEDGIITELLPVVDYAVKKELERMTYHNVGHEDKFSSAAMGGLLEILRNPEKITPETTEADFKNLCVTTMRRRCNDVLRNDTGQGKERPSVLSLDKPTRESKRKERAWGERLADPHNGLPEIELQDYVKNHLTPIIQDMLGKDSKQCKAMLAQIQYAGQGYSREEIANLAGLSFDQFRIYVGNARESVKRHNPGLIKEIESFINDAAREQSGNPFPHR